MESYASVRSLGRDLSHKSSVGSAATTQKGPARSTRAGSVPPRYSDADEEYGLQIPWDMSGAGLLTMLTHTTGRLGGFVMLDMSKLEVKLLQEQQRLMELEQQAMMAQWAAPTRGASLARLEIEASVLSRATSVMPSARSQQNSLTGIPPAAHENSSLHHRISGYSGRYDDDEYGSDEEGHAGGGEDGEEGLSRRVSQQRPQPRPDVICTSSARLLELFEEGKARMAARAMARSSQASFMPPINAGAQPRGWATLATKVTEAPGDNQPPRAYGRDSATNPGPLLAHAAFAQQSELEAAASTFSVFSPNQNNRHQVAYLKGTALAAQALSTIERAERLLQKLKDNSESPFDSRPGTSHGELALFEQHLAVLRNSTSIPSEESHAAPLDTRKSKRQANLWSKSIPEGGMLKSVHCMSRRFSRRRSGTGTVGSLAYNFLNNLGYMDEFNLVNAARQRLDMMQNFERLMDSLEERGAPDREAQNQFGLAIAEHILQELQHRIDTISAAMKAAAGAGGSKKSSKEAEAIAAEPSAAPTTVTQEGSFLNEDRLEELRREFAPHLPVSVVTRDGQVMPMPQTPDGANFSGAFGRVEDFRKRERHQRAALIQYNPVAFMEESAEQAEAQYRALAERAQSHFRAHKQAMAEPRLVEEFMKAVKYLQADRPYFLPPIVVKKGLKRPPRTAAARKEVPEWVVDGSVYEARKKENESRDVYDTEKAKTAQFSLDWQRVASKNRFRRMVGRVDMGVKADEQGLDRELAEVRLEMTKYKEHLRAIFTYYGSLTPKLKSDDIMLISMTTWLQFCSEAKVVDNSQRGCTLQDLQTIFVVVNYEEEKDTNESDANDDDAMMRFEFYEGIVRAAWGKFIASGLLDDASDAVCMFMEEVVLPHVPAQALVDPNDFRRNRLYTKEMDAVVKEWLPLLQAIHKVYRAKDHTKHWWIEHWATFLDACKLVGNHTGVSKPDTKLVFCWSQMLVTDELKRRKRAVALTLFDLIEAVARLADIISLPTEAELDALAQQRVIGLRAQRQQADSSNGAVGQEDIWTGYGGKLNEHFKACTRDPSLIAKARRKSAGFMQPCTRPLAEKFASLMSYIFCCMRDQWGGKSIEDCARRMTKMANIMSGGIELA